MFMGYFLQLRSRIFLAPSMIQSEVIQDVTYENIYIKEPEQWGIWIGPAQQSDSRRFWQGDPCSLLFPGC